MLENINESICVGETKEYKYDVNLEDENALIGMEEYNINLNVTLTYDCRGEKKTQVSVKVGNLDYQEEKTEEKRKNSNTGQILTQASTELNGVTTAIQFSGNYFSDSQMAQMNEFVNAWISELILAKYVDKSELEAKVTDKIADEWLKKLGVDKDILTIPGQIEATTFLETETTDGETVFVEFDINLLDFDFGDSGMPTMATGSGTATVYNKEGEILDSSVILPAYADICAFCEQLQKIAKDTIFSSAKEHLKIFGISADSTAEALSSDIMVKLLNCKYTKNIFKTVSAKDMKSVLEKITVKAEKYANNRMFKLLTTPAQGSTKVTVKCPVDVKVYDNDGNLCGVITNNTVDDTYSDIYMTVVGDQKNIYLVGDDYTFEMTGTDAGTMDYIIEEFDEAGNVTREISYEDVALSEGCKYYSYVPEAVNLNSTLFDLADDNGNYILPTAGADEIEDGTESAEIIDGGSCGENVEWTLYEDGLLRIYGSGAMKDYLGPCYPEWRYRKIEKVQIEEGVTSIGNYAFYDCSSLTSIEIPEGVTSIGNYTFGYCNSLTSIEIPEGVASIGNYAFGYCSSLTSIEIPEGVTSMGDEAFWYCSSLTSIEIPEGVTSIGDEAFRYCSSLTSIRIPEGVASIGDGAFSGCSSLTGIEIPEGVTSIGDVAFSSCSGLTSIEIPEGVTSIGDSVFYDCSSLTSIEIPEGVTSIGRGAFYYCSSLASIEIPEGVTSIGDEAFYDCSSLTSIEIPEGVTSIGVMAFKWCNNLASIEIPEGVTSIGDSAFSGCSSLTSIEIPEGVTSIGDEAFSSCSGLTSIEIPEGVTSIGDSAFYDCSSLTSIEIPEGVTSIGRGAFYYCSSLASIEIPEGVTSIGSNAFRCCSSLTSIRIPEGVVSIGDYAFSDCSSLTSIEIPEGVASIGDSAFRCCSSLTSIEIPEGVTSIGVMAFAWCSNMAEVIFPQSLIAIGSDAFTFFSRLTIYGYTGSYAETYANENGATFVSRGMMRVPAISVTLNKTTVTLNKGTTETLTATMHPVDTTDTLIWTSSNNNIVTVSNGVITAVAAGKATITVTTTSGKIATCEVTVEESIREPIEIPAASIKLNKTKVTLNKGKTVTLTANMAPADTTDVIKWKSSNKKVASVTTKGTNKVVVTGLKKGTSTITATTTSGKKAICTLTVKETKATKIKLNKAKVTINKGKTVTLKATVTPNNSTDNIKWTSSNKKVVKVTANGKKATISGLKKGTVTITAKTDGGKKATCKITVKEIKATKVKLNKTKATVKVGKYVTLKAILTPKNSTDTVTWKSSNAKVAKVSDKGKVMGVKKGNATITAKTSSGKKVTCKVTVK